MGQTITEKILSQKIGRTVYAGIDGDFATDCTIYYDFPGILDLHVKLLKDFGVSKIEHPEKIVFFLDHFTVAGDAAQASFHTTTREFGREQEIRVIEGRGIGHQVSCEMGLASPGRFLVHFDGHASTMGACGCLALGLGRGALEALALGTVEMSVPHTVRINLTGRLNRGVAARDLFHTIVTQIGPAGGRQCVIEFGGDGIAALNMDDRMTLCNQVMFVEGLTGIVEPDEVTYRFFEEQGVPYDEGFRSDPDANYLDVVTVDLSKVEPVLVVPPSSANTEALTAHTGKPVNSAYVGSCAAGRMRDLEQLCELLDGKRIAEGFRLHVVPSSSTVQANAAEAGLMKKLLDAGARVHSPTCDFCFGKLGVITDGETALSTGTLNVPGRMGSPNATIYLASPYSIAAAALTGMVTDPRTLLH